MILIQLENTTQIDTSYKQFEMKKACYPVLALASNVYLVWQAMTELTP